jgi:hypothetical protein
LKFNNQKKFKRCLAVVAQNLSKLWSILWKRCRL